MNSKTEEYTTRIYNATPLQLVIITYDIVIDKINDTISSKNELQRKENLIKIHSCLDELICSLDLNIDISQNLLSIYLYIKKLIITAEIKNNINNEKSISKMNELLKESYNILNTLLIAWNEIAKNNIDYLYKDKQQLFAGLTYKNGKLTEYINDDINRGYKI